MKIRNFPIAAVLLTLAMVGCDDSTSDEFEEVNGNVKEKYLKGVTTLSPQNDYYNRTFAIGYDSNNRVSTASNGSESSIFVYDDNGSLSNITGGNSDAFSMNELYKSPYDAFEVGHVEEYDDNGNPKIISFIEEDYDYEIQDYVYEQYTAELEYDNVPNPYFHTLKAAGFIEAMDKVQLNFSMTPQASEIVAARNLFPNNNPTRITYKNSNNEIIYLYNADYEYDNDNYPTEAVITTSDLNSGETSQYTVIYSYKD
ncbi:hypothetical protein [Galbibacter orientalis]|uniref:hypothetical protein n=1 Tax=Galbibacter orientalis TaxID=453852 RepID=UPI00308015F9